jgi:hypothetical protein
MGGKLPSITLLHGPNLFEPVADQILMSDPEVEFSVITPHHVGFPAAFQLQKETPIPCVLSILAGITSNQRICIFQENSGRQKLTPTF